MYAGLDQQLGDLTWSIATGLRAGYSLRQVFEALAAEAPEPAASACKRLLAELDQGLDFNAALASWQRAIPSAALARLAGVLQQPAHSAAQSGSLPNSLDPLSEDLLRECGSDPAFYAPMRREAEQLGAKVPERALNTID